MRANLSYDSGLSNEPKLFNITMIQWNPDFISPWFSSILSGQRRRIILNSIILALLACVRKLIYCRLESFFKGVCRMHFQPIIWFDQNFSISRYKKNLKKNYPYQRSNENLFLIMIIGKVFNKLVNKIVFHFKWVYWFFRTHMKFFKFLRLSKYRFCKKLRL